jgi:hypothetical protein
VVDFNATKLKLSLSFAAIMPEIVLYKYFMLFKKVIIKNGPSAGFRIPVHIYKNWEVDFTFGNILPSRRNV